MKLKHSGLDHNSTYFEHNIDSSSSDIVTVFIHGVGLDNTMWLPQKKIFKKKKVVFYDLINHGKTKKSYKEIHFENFNQQLIQLLDFLNIKKMNLVGFSIGALIAQHFTSQYFHKINKLIIIASVYKRTEEQINKVKNRYKMALDGQNITNDSINRWFNSEYLEKNPDVYNYFYNILQKKNNEDFLSAYKLFIESDNYALNFSNFNMPTLIMTGENEIGSTPNMSKMLHQEINNSKLYIIPKAKHMVTYEKADEVSEKINNFIE